MEGDRWFFDRIAPVYDWFSPSTDAGVLADGLARAERPVETVLDVGGGTGRAARAVDAPRRVVFDASAPMLRRVPPGIGRVRGDARQLPFGDASVDAVVVSDALHHLPEPRRVLREAGRVVAPGGVVVVREFDPSTRRGRLLQTTEHLLGMESQFFTAEELSAMLGAAGLDPEVLETGFTCTVVGREPGG